MTYNRSREQDIRLQHEVQSQVIVSKQTDVPSSSASSMFLKTPKVTIGPPESNHFATESEQQEQYNYKPCSPFQDGF